MTWDKWLIVAAGWLVLVWVMVLGNRWLDRQEEEDVLDECQECEEPKCAVTCAGCDEFKNACEVVECEECKRRYCLGCCFPWLNAAGKLEDCPACREAKQA